jgi:hypothetical protein
MYQGPVMKFTGREKLIRPERKLKGRNKSNFRPNKKVHVQEKLRGRRKRPRNNIYHGPTSTLKGRENNISRPHK